LDAEYERRESQKKEKKDKKFKEKLAGKQEREA
jgi:DNA-repair protein complementing XP-A cells